MPLSDALRSLFFPTRCPYCQRVIGRGESWCPLCREALGRQAGLRWLGENLPCAYSFSYAGSPREAILRFKFKGRVGYAAALAVRGAEAADEFYPEIRFDVVTAVPLSRKRRKQRGYNQAERYARELSRMLKSPYEELLDKTKENQIQHSLHRDARAGNVRGVYGPKGNAAGKTVLLCDDIVTSGATLRECARVLRQAGADRVCCLVIAAAQKQILLNGDKL